MQPTNFRQNCHIDSEGFEYGKFVFQKGKTSNNVAQPNQNNKRKWLEEDDRSTKRQCVEIEKMQVVKIDVNSQQSPHLLTKSRSNINVRKTTVVAFEAKFKKLNVQEKK